MDGVLACAHGLMRDLLVETDCAHATFKDHLAPDRDAQPVRVKGYAAVACGGDQPAPVGVCARPGALVERAVRDGAGDLPGVVFGLGASDFECDDVGDSLAVVDDLVREAGGDQLERPSISLPPLASVPSFTPLAPLASRSTVSLVEVSPSIEIELKLRSTAGCSNSASCAGSAARSVKR